MLHLALNFITLQEELFITVSPVQHLYPSLNHTCFEA